MACTKCTEALYLHDKEELFDIKFADTFVYGTHLKPLGVKSSIIHHSFPMVIYGHYPMRDSVLWIWFGLFQPISMKESICEASTMGNAVQSLVYIVAPSTDSFKCFNFYYTIYCNISWTQFLFWSIYIKCFFFYIS